MNVQKNKHLSKIVISASDKHFITIPDSFCGKSLNDYKYKNSRGKVKQLTLSDKVIFGLIYAFQRQGLPFHMGGFEKLLKLLEYHILMLHLQ